MHHGLHRTFLLKIRYYIEKYDPRGRTRHYYKH